MNKRSFRAIHILFPGTSLTPALFDSLRFRLVFILSRISYSLTSGGLPSLPLHVMKTYLTCPLTASLHLWNSLTEHHMLLQQGDQPRETTLVCQHSTFYLQPSFLENISCLLSSTGAQEPTGIAMDYDLPVNALVLQNRLPTGCGPLQIVLG